MFVHTVQENKEGIMNREIRDTEKERYAYNMVGHPSSVYSKHMVRGNMLKNFPLALPI